MTRYEAAVMSAFTGLLVGSFADMHEYAEYKFGHPVWTHEFASDDVAAQLKELARSDFMAICAQVEGTPPLNLEKAQS